MTDNFQSLSNEIAKDFLQSVVFIDDKAYSAVDGADTQHDFDAKTITRGFASNHKICSVFQPEKEADIQLFSDIAAKADVTVLDWQIIIQNSTELSATESDEDDDDDDIRGSYTKCIIRNLLGSPSKLNSLKLILVYTGETDLNNIATEILSYLTTQEISGFSLSGDDDCCVVSGSCKILVRAKSNGGNGRGTHNPALRDKEVTYQQLPEFINNEFAKMTNGLLSNFTLKALTVIRKNFFQVLNIFSKKLDAAYLTHKSLLPNINDANELLVELLGDTFTSILRVENLSSSINTEVIELWIEQYIEEEERAKLDNSGKPTAENFSRDKDILKSLLVSSEDVKQKIINALISKGISANSAKNNYKKYAFSLFHESGEDESLNRDFALLCQHKDLIKYDNHTPVLTLGTVVKSNNEEGSYYVCIQQRCDSVRVDEQQARRFLFLSLSIVNQDSKFDFITPGGDKLKLGKSIYDMRTVKFSGSSEGTVKAEDESEKMYFVPFYYSEELTEKFEFIFELKDLYAQRIVVQYSSSLSRVGLDEPEWIRLS
ncbi:response regulator receiver domain [Psychromonas sp. GE-S-Ul-11]|uniref:response regulator receiver domain n=1 Tax=Psychromonas sp. GE-S-Ul-11 TaxID=3241170 RepID=UPI00390CCF72